MNSPFDTALAQLLSSLFDSKDALAPLRRNAARRSAGQVGLDLAGDPLEDALCSYADKVASEPYKTIDEDVAALRANGRSKAEIFDLTVATAVGASLARLRRASSVIDEVMS